MARKLLLADDSITIQKVVELVLAEEDFVIKSVGNGEDALNLLDGFRPDIVLADIEMPKLNGYQLCEKIKKNPATSDIPVILLAGAFEPIDADMAKSSGADDSVIKPFESQELISKINAVLTMAAQSAGGAGEVEAVAFEDESEATMIFAEEAEPVAVAVEATAVEEDLWAMEDLGGGPEQWAEETIAEEAPPMEEEAFELTEVMAVPEVEIKAPESPRRPIEPAPAAQAAPVAAPEVKREVVFQEIQAPSKEELLAVFNKNINEKMGGVIAALPVKDALVSALAPQLKDAVEKVLWEVAPDLVEKLIKEALKDTVSSISKEVEKVIWETVPDLASTMISKEIEKIRSEF